MEWIKELGKIYRQDKDDYYISTDSKNIDSAISILKKNKIDNIITISATDTKKDIEVIYHFTHKKGTINIKICLDRNIPKTKTITGKYPGALLYEKEAAEMLGIKIEGIDNAPLLLSKHSPLYPLRRE
ncbi:MAG: NADH-quinone oxidoreductase subunit C [archaeon]|nr:NADH-quinone oxidoreductase subunit C [archaeon]